MSTAPRETHAKSSELVRWLWFGYLRKYVGLFLLAFVFMALEGSMLGAVSYMMQPMFDNVFVAGRGDLLIWLGVLLIGIFLTRAISGVMRAVILTTIAQRSAASLRIDMLDRMMQQDGAFHQANPPGFLIQRVQTDVIALNDIWRSIVTAVGRDLFGLLVLLGVAVSVDPVWALLACIGLPLLVLPAATAQRFIRKQARKARDIGASLSTRLDEVFHGIVQVKLNALEEYQSAQYREMTDTFVKLEVRSAFGSAALPAMIDVISGLGFMAVILYGGSEIIAGEKTIGQFMSFLTAMGFAFDPLRRLGGLTGLWQQAAAAMERIKELLEAPITQASPENPVAPPQGVPGVALEEVSMRYGDTEVLTHLSLTAKAGETTALVGASGAGKSTVFNLLTRLVDPHDGSVTIGGVKTTDMAIADLRSLYSVVTQEALLFDESLRENIVLGRTDVSDARLKEVLDAAHVSDFVDGLANGLDTPVGPRGSALSGGQRQRVVIARALLRDTPILLLDEATSALDAASEKTVQAALDRLAAGRTTLVIAHRLSTIRAADKIVVLDKGRVVDEGTHDALLAREGIYADLYRLQFEGGKTVSDPPAPGQSVEMGSEQSNAPSGIWARLRGRIFR